MTSTILPRPATAMRGSIVACNERPDNAVSRRALSLARHLRSGTNSRQGSWSMPGAIWWPRRGWTACRSSPSMSPRARRRVGVLRHAQRGDGRARRRVAVDRVSRRRVTLLTVQGALPIVRENRRISGIGSSGAAAQQDEDAARGAGLRPVANNRSGLSGENDTAPSQSLREGPIRFSSPPPSPPQSCAASG